MFTRSGKFLNGLVDCFGTIPALLEIPLSARKRGINLSYRDLVDHDRSSYEPGQRLRRHLPITGTGQEPPGIAHRLVFRPAMFLRQALPDKLQQCH